MYGPFVKLLSVKDNIIMSNITTRKSKILVVMFMIRGKRRV